PAGSAGRGAALHDSRTRDTRLGPHRALQWLRHRRPVAGGGAALRVLLPLAALDAWTPLPPACRARRLRGGSDGRGYDPQLWSRGWGSLMTRELRVAVAGFGKMGMLHAALLNVLPEVELCAVAEPHPLVRRFARRLLPRARFYADVGRVLEREVPDAVFVTAPTGLHAPLCEAVLQAGSALFVEKPLAADSASC